jgi:hypothetical protein
MDRRVATRELTRGRFEVVLAQPDDDAHIRRLLRRTAFGRPVVLGFEREPNASLAAGIEGDRHYTVMVRPGCGGAPLGMGSRSVRLLWLGGKAARVGYLGLLRRAPGFTAASRKMAEAYARLDATRGSDESGWDYTSILAGNLPARRLLESGRHGLPVYWPIGSFHTFVATTRGRGARGAVDRGCEEFVPEIVRCLRHGLRWYALAPVWTDSDLRSGERCRGLGPGDFFVRRRNGEVTACLALWDQRAFKQTVVRGYTPALLRLRALANLVLRTTSMPRLPTPPQTLAAAFLSHLAGDPDDLAILAREARAEAARRGLDYVVYGADARDPVHRTLRRALGGLRIESVIYSVHPPGRPQEPPDFGAALLRPEVATL